MEVLLESLHLGGRTVVIYIVAVIMVKLMGKREVGQLSPLDFVVGVIIGSVASAPMVDVELPLIPTLIPLVVLGGLEILASVLALNNKKVRRFLEDRPAIVVRDGQIIKDNMAKIRMNMDDLKQELRKYGVVDINQVEEGSLESCGTFTVILKKEYQPLTLNDLKTTSLNNLDQVIGAYALKARSNLENILDRHY
jgi:uncharacterized membrane protein YcaP (DUF421 family)